MSDQMFRDLVSILLIGTVVLLVSMGKTVDPQVKEWADVAFGFLFGIKSGPYVIGKPSGDTKSVDRTVEIQKQEALKKE